MLEPGRRRDALETAVARAVRRFGPRIYSFDIAAAEAAARTLRMARAAGLGIHQIPGKLADLQTAGIAIAHGLQLATHNIGDFQGLGLDLIDPRPASNDGEHCGKHFFLQHTTPSATSVAESAPKGDIDLGTNQHEVATHVSGMI